MKAEREWLKIIHCANHRLELAVGDAFKEDDAFKKVDDIALGVWLHVRDSGKAKRILMSIAASLGVIFVSFNKSSGTRFQNHKYRAIKALIINYIALINYCENAVAGGTKVCKADVAAKLKGYLKSFYSYKYLASLHFYHRTLKQTAHMAYLMQTTSTLITDIIDAMEECREKLDELQTSEVELPFETIDDETRPDEVIIEATATNLPATLTFRNKAQMCDKQKDRAMKDIHVVKE